MTLVVTEDPDQVARSADEMAAADPVVNIAFGSIASAVRDADAAPWSARPAATRAVLAARSHAHTPVCFSAGWSDLAEVCDAMRALVPPAAAVTAAPATTEAVVRGLGATVSSRMDERLFRLDALSVPSGVRGSARLADDEDTSWLAAWYTDFAIEAFGRTPPGFDATRMIERGVRRSRCWIWTDDDTPVSFAVRHPAVCGVSRIGPVYTPPDLRGHGFGSAATAAATRDILDDGDIACLFTDLANPTSNHIYQQLGYRAIADRTAVHFD